MTQEHEMTDVAAKALSRAKHPKDWRKRAAISIEEAGAELGVGRSLIYSMAARGQLPTIQCGSRRLVPVHALRRMLGEVD